MTATLFNPRLSFEAYVDFCAQTDERYELVRGELQHMTPPEWQYLKIAKFLERLFDAEIERIGQPWEAFRDSGQRTEGNSSRLPDVSVVPTDAIAQYLKQTAILEVPAILVVEIVSPSSIGDDYDDNRREYEALGVPEYWIVDHDALGAATHLGFPKEPTVTVNQLDGKVYQSSRFKGRDRIISATFPALQLTTEQIFQVRQ